MMQHLDTQADLDNAIRALVAHDPRLAPVVELAGLPPLRRREPGFAGLASIICGQQLSTMAAAAIWNRLTVAYDPFHHDHIRRARADRLGRLGLSAAKIKTLKFIAAEIAKGRLDLAVLAETPADDAHGVLTALHGIGPWTADIYLLFCLGHGDAWPVGDLAVQEAVRLALDLPTRPTQKEMAALGDIWRPWRGAAAHLFWAYYKVVKAPGFEAVVPGEGGEAGKNRAAAKPAVKSSTKSRIKPQAKSQAKPEASPAGRPVAKTSLKAVNGAKRLKKPAAKAAISEDLKQRQKPTQKPVSKPQSASRDITRTRPG